jgi:hypothetical protein
MAVTMQDLNGWPRRDLIERALRIGVQGRPGAEGDRFEQAKRDNFRDWDIPDLKKFIVRNEK